MSTLLFTSPLFQQHETGTHPENARRLRAIERKLEEADHDGKWERGEPVTAEPRWLQAVHEAGYLQRVEKMATAGGERLDADTIVSPLSWQTATLAAGTACHAVQQVCFGAATRALCLLRPPGHHALRSRGMGFCLINNIAVAAQYARQHCQLKNVLIVDWDVHHGNGTQDLFYGDGQVHFYSIHRSPFYPGTGDADETGTGAGLGATLNVPIHFGTARKDFFEKFEQGLEASLKRSRPELILISAGFDAHRLDPIGSLGLETEDFGRLTDLVVAAAQSECSGRIVSLLEGGYHLTALADSVMLHLQRLSASE